MRTSRLTRRHPATHAADPQPAHAGPLFPVAHDHIALAPTLGERLTDPGSASLQDPQHVAEGAAGCEIGEAIAILMARYPISYTKAFAAMIASTERTQRSMPELATAVIRAHARQPVSSRANLRRVDLI